MYAFKGDSIVLTNIGSLASVEIEAKAVLLDSRGRPDEVSTGIITAQSDRTIATDQSSQRFKHDGEVLAAYIRVLSGSPVRGELFGVLGIRDGGELCRGYLTGEQGVILGISESSLSGRGLIRSIDLEDPAANAEFATQTVPANTGWRVVSWAAVLVQGATQTPRPSLFFSDDSDVEVARMSWGATQAANVTARYGAFLGAGNSHVLLNAVPGGGGAVSMPLPDIILPAGYDIDSDTINKGANTNWGDGQMLVEEWLVA